MRLVAEHTEQDILRRFVDYLRARGIGAEMREGHSVWGLWVHHEDRCAEVRKEFSRFLHDPSETRYELEQPAPTPASSAVSAPAPSRTDASMTQRLARLTARRPNFLQGPTPVTKVLLALSIAATLPIILSMPLGDLVRYWLRADERLITQWWRLLTPAFLHFNLLHIVFNMLWLRELGSRIERIKGPGFMLMFFVISAGISNYAQWVAGAGYPFGGMSGVVYGLFGYIWMKSRIAPEQGFSIDPGTVMMLMLWFFLGWTGIMPIANWAHGFGLGSGIALALAPERRRNPTPDPLGD